MDIGRPECPLSKDDGRCAGVNVGYRVAKPHGIGVGMYNGLPGGQELAQYRDPVRPQGTQALSAGRQGAMQDAAGWKSVPSAVIEGNDDSAVVHFDIVKCTKPVLNDRNVAGVAEGHDARCHIFLVTSFQASDRSQHHLAR